MNKINQKKLIVLIPFWILQLQKLIQKEPTKNNFIQLRDLIRNDIVSSIEANQKVGNITETDADKLRSLTQELLNAVYANYFTLGGCDDMKPILEGAIELPLDKYLNKIDVLMETVSTLEKKKNSLAEEVDHLALKANNLTKEKDSLVKEKDFLAKEKDLEIQALRDKIKELEAKNNI
ncbi:MAG: hypothetical protein PHP50_02000 [Lachnospiraceae bacterium]|nr:hypothetical protein [Lachnospiraceae bacterium]